MRLERDQLGKFGEHTAAAFYRVRGYTIVARNARSPEGEIDLIARRGAMLAIVEVKARQTHTAGEGHEAVTRQKRERLVRLGNRFAELYPTCQLRYDIVSLFWNGWRFEISHFEDAFRPVADHRRPWIWRA